MQVILLKDVEKLGLRGEVVDVARGYARNYLLPRKLAENATPARVAEIERALVAAVRSRENVEIQESSFAVDLITQDGACTGVVIALASGELVAVSAQVVVLAAGGAGQLWATTSNPPAATADGLAMAIRAGAAVADLEFCQFHPTVLQLPGKTQLRFAVNRELVPAQVQAPRCSKPVNTGDPEQEIAHAVERPSKGLQGEIEAAREVLGIRNGPDAALPQHPTPEGVPSRPVNEIGPRLHRCLR